LRRLRDVVKGYPLSLSQRLLGGLVLPMSALALALGVGGALAIHTVVESVHDQILGAVAHGVAESLAVENQEIKFSLPASAFALFESNNRHSVFYAVRHGNQVITGYTDLPFQADMRMFDGDVRFTDGEYHGEPVRIVVEARRLPRVNGLVVVQVAESMNARDALEQKMLFALAGLEAALILLSAFMIPLAVRWGIHPLRRLQTELEVRAATDLTPLPTEPLPKELVGLVGAFNGLLGRLKTAIDGLTHFTSNASHQMRTSLAILRTHLSVLRNAEPGSEQADQSMTDLGEAIERLQHLVIHLLALARADAAGSKLVELEPTDLGQLCQEVTSDFVGEALKKRVDLQFEKDDQVSLVAMAHPLLTREVIGNLIDNAIRYGARDGGQIIVEVRRNADAISLSIEDNGPGIPEAEREQAFDRFQRLDTSSKAQGSGLGLPIVQALSRAMAARIHLETGRDGLGLRAIVTYPLPPGDRILSASHT
jgi:two-component system sensor histidine kinase TctE